MMRLALKGLAGRKLRSALTAFAIVLGVAMVSGTLILTDTIDRGFDTVYTRAYENSDAVISAKTEAASAQRDAGGFSSAVLTRLREHPDIESAAGSVVDEARLISRDGEVLGGGGVAPMAFGIDPRTDERLNPLSVTDGALPQRRGEIAIDAATAAEAGYGVGDTIEVAARGPAREFNISGLVEFGGVQSMGGSTIAVFDITTAQNLFDKTGKLDIVRLAGRDGVSPEQLVAATRPQLTPALQVRTGEAQAQAESGASGEGIGFLRYFLLAFGAIALFVGSFVIANTLSITVAQRTRELATVRTLGGSRRQVLMSVVVESLVVGVVASLIGLFLGLGLAQGLNALLKAIGMELPTSGTVFSERTILVSLLLGVLITLIASIRPALRATRVAPIAAVREGATLPASRYARFNLPAALLVIAVAVAMLLAGTLASGLSTSGRLTLSAVGSLLLFVGVALVAPRLVRPLASVLGWPAARAGGPAGRLARANAMRNPSRTAATASALMIGLALVTFVGILGQGLRSTFIDSVEELFTADYAVTAESGFAPLSPEVQAAVAQDPAVRAVSAVRSGEVEVGGEELSVTAVDENIGRVIGIRWHEGSDAVPAQLGSDGAFVTRAWAEDKGLDMGDPLEMTAPTGTTLDLTVKGIWEEPKGGSPFGSVTTSHAALARAFPQTRNDFTFINMEGGVSAANTAALERVLGAFPDAKVQSRDEFRDAQIAQLSQVLNVLYALLALSVIVSLFGIVNTLVLTVFERTRELGMLRAVGMTRRQARSMIRHESIVTALLGATLGIITGVFLAALVAGALSDEGFSFAIPYGSLALFVVAAILVGVLAAIFPARRAARLKPLEALQYE